MKNQSHKRRLDIDMLNYTGFTAHFVFLDLLLYKYILVTINLVSINVKETVPTVNLWIPH